ncbi:MAG: HAMP domain-containing histidine kinase [Clostridia bacterium]|nr:HAMP domain-containing histidine kinase [Clostridia bacterium]
MKLLHSKGAKASVVFLLILMLITVFLSAAAVLVMEENSVYLDGGIILRQNVAESVYHMKSNVFYNYVYAVLEENGKGILLESYEIQTSRKNTNLSVRAVLEETGEEILQNYKSGAYSYEFSSIYRVPLEDNRYQNVVITSYLQEELSAKDAFYYALGLTDFCINTRYALIWIGIGAFLVSILLIVFLLCAAGHRRGTEGVFLRMFDRLPLEIVAAAYYFLFMFTLAISDMYFYNGVDLFIYAAIACIVWVVLLVQLLTTLAVRIKAKTFLKNTIIYRILKLLWRGVRIIFSACREWPLFWKTAVAFLLWCFLEFIFLASARETFAVFWCFTRPILGGLLIWAVRMMRRLQKAGEELAAGNTNYQVDTRYMPPDFRRHGEALNNLRAGLNRAVEERMKSERMKAELITNVSHDIKTPLTSIVNYVDLLKAGGLDSPDAPEYLEILEHQSMRLKKLTEDLIEASKASSGCMPCNPQATDVNVLLSQALGEHEEALRAAGIEPVIRLSEENPVIMADGRLLWRVFDNLFTNIRKYALPSARAYFTCEVDKGEAVIVFRNISRVQLEIEADELSERFVRGDASRHTEGSGLGLSIARSLTELQGGTFDITIDGDLFKVTICFAVL